MRERDPDALADAIRTNCRGPRHARWMAHAARERAGTTHGNDTGSDWWRLLRACRNETLPRFLRWLTPFGFIERRSDNDSVSIAWDSAIRTAAEAVEACRYDLWPRELRRATDRGRSWMSGANKGEFTAAAAYLSRLELFTLLNRNPNVIETAARVGGYSQRAPASCARRSLRGRNRTALHGEFQAGERPFTDNRCAWWIRRE